MKTPNLTKLIGINKFDFDKLVSPIKGSKVSPQIEIRPSMLIPVLKTGDEMALTSIFLSSLKLVKEFRYKFFREIKFPKGGQLFFYTEVGFPKLFNERIDGLIINVSSGKIKDAVFLEMKGGNNDLDKSQIEKYIVIARKLKINKLVTISNQFVSDPKETPIEKIKVPPSFSLYHFSWTSILTSAQILLSENDQNIEDRDQVNIMREVVNYLEHPKSGLLGHSSMGKSWKEICDKINNNERIKKTDDNIKDAVSSWHQQEKYLALLMSRSLGSPVKSSLKNKSSIESDIKKIIDKQLLYGSLTIENTVSKIDIRLDFNKKTVTFSISIIPPIDRKNNGKVSFLFRQLEKCKRREGKLFNSLEDDIFVEPFFKFLRSQNNFSLVDLQSEDFRRYNDIQKFQISLVRNFKSNFASSKKFVSELESETLKFYESIVQHLSNWKKPVPKIDNFSDIITN
tara:strand:+ start:1711 stop:3075 length:1365 start_codon:yes stop_codon:yes gene_type:complete